MFRKISKFVSIETLSLINSNNNLKYSFIVSKKFYHSKVNYVERNDFLINSKKKNEKTNALPKNEAIYDLEKYNKDITIIEGVNLINDVIQNDYPKLKKIYYSDDSKLNRLLNFEKLKQNKVQFIKKNKEVLKKYTDVITPQNIFGVFNKIETESLYTNISSKYKPQLPLILISNKIHDPGNMGTLIRSSAACGLSKIICIKENSRVLHPKIIRASCGAVFKIPIIEKIEIEDIENHLPKNVIINFYLSDSNTNDNLIVKDYTKINYYENLNSCNVLIINGETGINESTLNYIKSLNGIKINIPTNNEIDSLNSSIAGSIIMFEMKRQFLNLQN